MTYLNLFRYYWGSHEAVRQLRDIAKAHNRTADFREWDAAEIALTEKMRPEFEEALRINREHDQEMEQRYSDNKTRKGSGSVFQRKAPRR